MIGRISGTDLFYIFQACWLQRWTNNFFSDQALSIIYYYLSFYFAFLFYGPGSKWVNDEKCFTSELTKNMNDVLKIGFLS